MKNIDNKLRIFIEHRVILVDYVTRITGCRSKAEDVVQDAYLRYMPDDIKNTSVSPLSFLYRIVRNLAIDLVRRSAMETRYLQNDIVTWLEPTHQATPEASTLQNEQLEKVVEIMSKLPEKERLAVEMHRFGDYTLKEIGERLDISTSTVHRMIQTSILNIAKGLDETE